MILLDLLTWNRPIIIERDNVEKSNEMDQELLELNTINYIISSC